jgi:hypothetical protein
MSRDTENQSSTQHGSGAAHSGQEIDFDAEHSPEVSRRASNAVLRHKAAQLRTADASVANAPQADRDKQHEKADLAELHGLQSAIMLAAKHLTEDAAFIHLTVGNATGTDASVSPALQLVDARITKANAEVGQLSKRIGTAGSDDMTAHATHLAHEFGALNHGVFLLDQAVTEAKNLAYRHRPETLNSNTSSLHASFESIRRDLKLDEPGVTIQSTAVDARPENVLFAETLGFNLTAVYDAARSVRMGIGAKTELHVEADLVKVVRHVGAVADLLRQVTDRKALTSHKPRIREVLAEIHGLEKQIEHTSNHADKLSKGPVVDNLRLLQNALDR